MDHAIIGIVSSRSSKKTGGPPGEAEILALNPQREARLKSLMDWSRVEPGTLNVECDEDVLARVIDVAMPVWFEESSTITYPSKYDYIPQLRQGYRYFRVRVSSNLAHHDVLLRRAINPLKGRVELFADVSLKRALSAKDGDCLLVTLV